MNHSRLLGTSLGLQNIRAMIRALFVRRRICILGNRMSGKTSLHNFLNRDTPLGADGAAPDRTLGFDGGSRARRGGITLLAKSDVEGDDLGKWVELLSTSRPHGIIYMLDGAQSEEELEADLRTRLLPVLMSSREEGSLDSVRVVYAFLNKLDLWSTTSSSETARRKRSLTGAWLDDLLHAHIGIPEAHTRVCLTCLKPEYAKFPDTVASIRDFAKALDVYCRKDTL